MKLKISDDLRGKLGRLKYGLLAFPPERKATAEQSNGGGPDVSAALRRRVVYIGEIYRSGGTLMRRLLDGHPDLLVFPHELGWEANGYHFEEDLGSYSLDEIQSKLKNRWITQKQVKGLTNGVPFHYSRKRHREYLLEALRALDEPRVARDCLKLDLESFFAAWGNYHKIPSKESAYAAFRPWDYKSIESIEKFFGVFPDGKRIHMVRSPLACYSSEKLYGHSMEYRVEPYIKTGWIPSIEVALEAKKRFPNQYAIVCFENLLREPEESMRRLSDFLGLDFVERLLVPTVNNVEVESNSSFSRTAKLDPSALERWRDVLDTKEKSFIETIAINNYNKAVALATNAL